MNDPSKRTPAFTACAWREGMFARTPSGRIGRVVRVDRELRQATVEWPGDDAERGEFRFALLRIVEG